MAQIEVHELTKRFRVRRRRAGREGRRSLRGSLMRRTVETVTALDRVSFTISSGELVGYIGPNGAGKSTTVKILSGILVPEDGECRVGDRVPWRDRIDHVRRIGVVFGQRTQLWWDLPVIDSLELLRDMYDVDAAAYRETLDELVAMLDLGPLLAVPVRQLSLGQRMRCDLAAALIHRPDVLFLDEPTIGLDATAKLAVRAFIADRKRSGVTTILTTHDMDDIETLCDRVVMIAHGRIAFDGSVAELRSRVTTERRLTAHLDADVTSPPEVAGARIVATERGRVVYAFDPVELPTARLIERLGALVALGDLFIEHPPIEQVIAEVYRSHIGGDIGEAG